MGFWVLSIASKLASESFRLESVTMDIIFGLDKVKSPSAYPAGSEVRGRIVTYTSNCIVLNY